MDNKHPSPRTDGRAPGRIVMPILGLVLGVASLFTGFGWGVGVALSVSGLVLSILSMRRGIRWAFAGVIISDDLTPFLTAAAATGARTHGGSHMLQGQIRLIAEFLGIAHHA